MKKSRVCALGLACFLGAVTAFSALAGTLGGGALLRNLSDKNALSSASLSGQNATENLTPEEQAKAELDAKILADGGLGLDPENDPVVYTTDWGLDIKFHADWGSFGTVSTSLSGYCYFTMGKCSGYNVNWVIIGRATNVAQSFYCSGQYTNLGTRYQNYTFTNYLTHSTTNSNYYKNNQHETSTDAGSVISGAGGKGLVYDFQYVLFSKSVQNAEIPSNCVLCISECVLVATSFAPYSSDYNGSTLQTVMNNLYSSDLGLTTTQKSYIQPQTLTQHHYDYAVSTVYNQYLFPLSDSATGDKFSHYTYLGNSSSRTTAWAYMIGTTTKSPWWLRSGYKNMQARVEYVPNNGGLSTSTDSWATTIKYSTGSLGARPAFVLKL